MNLALLVRSQRTSVQEVKKSILMIVQFDDDHKGHGTEFQHQRTSKRESESKYHHQRHQNSIYMRHEKPRYAES